jgi:hypothetical protein
LTHCHVEKYGDLGLIYHLQKTNWGFNWGVGCFRHRNGDIDCIIQVKKGDQARRRYPWFVEPSAY